MIKLKDLTENMENSNLQVKVKELEKSLELEYPEIQDLHLYIKSNGSLFIGSIRVKKEHRRKGIGKTIITKIKKFADENNLVISLAPEAEPRYKEKLDRFYKSLGFVANKGRKKDYRLAAPFSRTMYRRPGINEDNDYDPSWEYTVDKRPIIKVKKLIDIFLKELEPLQKTLNLNKINVHYITRDIRGGLARYINGTTNNPHFVVSTRVIYYAAKKYGVNLGTAIYTTLVHEFCHAYLESAGLDTSEHNEDFIEEVTQDYNNVKDEKRLKEKLDWLVNNTSETITEALDKPIPRILYHATFNALVPNISNEGLIPLGKNFRNYEEIEWGVYLSDDKDFAGSMAVSTENENIPEEWREQIVILVIDTSMLDKSKFDQDPHVQIAHAPSEHPSQVPRSYIYKGNIPYSAIKDIVDYEGY